ncbi:MAG: hypothetical protein HN730_09225, partial [Bdellovibrionales bacterium]|nr:hypothetical protein [Bdellovibrionales bacterium]
MSKHKRKEFFIYPKFQLRFIGWLLLPVLTHSAVLMTALHLITLRSEQLSHTIGLSPDHILFTFIDMQKQYMFWIYLSTTIFLAILLAIFGILLSHRLAGPIIKLKNHITAINNGTEATYV